MEGKERGNVKSFQRLQDAKEQQKGYFCVLLRTAREKCSTSMHMYRMALPVWLSDSMAKTL